MGMSYFKFNSEIKELPKTELKNTITKYDSLHFKILFLVMLLFLFYQIFAKFDKLFNILDNQNEIYNFGFQIIFLGVLYFFGFIKEYKKRE